MQATDLQVTAFDGHHIITYHYIIYRRIERNLPGTYLQQSSTLYGRKRYARGKRGESRIRLAHLKFGVCDAMAVAPNGGQDADMVAHRGRAERDEQPHCLRVC